MKIQYLIGSSWLTHAGMQVDLSPSELSDGNDEHPLEADSAGPGWDNEQATGKDN